MSDLTPLLLPSPSPSPTTTTTTKALDRIKGVIDPYDDLYTNQKALCDADVAFYLTELLQDESEAVAHRAAALIASMADHSNPTKVRLNTISLESNPSRLLLNPVQSDFIDAGVAPLLVPWLVSGETRKASIATNALHALSSYNHEGKIAYLSAVVDALSPQSWALLPFLDNLLSGLDSVEDEDVCNLLYKCLPNILYALKLPGQVGEHALSCIGTLLEKGAASLTVGEPGGGEEQGAETLEMMLADQLIRGSLHAQDLAARALWLMVTKKKPTVVLAKGGALDGRIEGMCVVLRGLVETYEAQEKKRDEEEDERGDDNDNGPEEETWAAEEVNTGHEEDLCHGDEAKELLKVILEENPELDMKGRGNEDEDDGHSTATTSCLLM